MVRPDGGGRPVRRPASLHQRKSVSEEIRCQIIFSKKFGVRSSFREESPESRCQIIFSMVRPYGFGRPVSAAGFAAERVRWRPAPLPREGRGSGEEWPSAAFGRNQSGQWSVVSGQWSVKTRGIHPQASSLNYYPPVGPVVAYSLLAVPDFLVAGAGRLALQWRVLCRRPRRPTAAEKTHSPKRPGRRHRTRVVRPQGCAAAFVDGSVAVAKGIAMAERPVLHLEALNLKYEGEKPAKHGYRAESRADLH